MSAPENTVEIPKSHVAICISIDSDIEKCTEEQKNIIIQIYANAKETVETIAAISELSDMVKIVKMIGGIIKLLETATYNNAKISGKNKNKVNIMVNSRPPAHLAVKSSYTRDEHVGIFCIFIAYLAYCLHILVHIILHIL